MKRIVISGYYGFDNTGDEAILHGLVRSLKEEAAARNMDICLTVLSANPAKTAATLNVEAVPRMDVKAILRSMGKCDLFISGGGGLLQDATGRGLSIVYYLALVLLARLFGKPAVIYAQGIGPVRRLFNKWLVRFALNRATVITVRDAGSAKLLAELGVSRPPVQVTADPAFLLAPSGDTSPLLSAFIGELPAGSPVIGVSVRPWRDQKKYLHALAEALNCLAAEFSATVVLVPMHYEDDLPVCRELAGLLRNRPLVLAEKLSPPEMLHLFSRFSMVLAMRLHALVFAAMCGAPPIGIGYDPKVDAFLERLGLESAGRPETLEAADLAAQAANLWRQRDELYQELKEKMAELASAARLNNELVLRILQEQNTRERAL